MNKLEERHYLLTNQGNCVIEAKAHAAITKEVAIGFRNWCDDPVRHSFIHERTKSIYFGKTDDELFEMYLNTLK